MAYIPYGPEPPNFPGFGTGESNYGSAPYQEAAQKARFRLSTQDRLLAALSGLGSVQPGMNFGQSFLAGLSGSARATWAAKQAAMNYAQRQYDQETARQNAETQRLIAEGKGEKDQTPPEYRPEYYDTDWAKAKRAADATKAAGGLTTIVGPGGKPTLVRESDAIGKTPYVKPDKPDKPQKEGPSIKDYGALQSNYIGEPTVKKFGSIRDSYRVIESSTKLASGFGDMAAITAYAKALDSDTGVKEQEFNNASEAIGYLQKAYNTPSKWFSGTRLTPSGRAELLRSAKELYLSRKKTYDITTENYKRVAKKYGVDPSDFIFDYGDTLPPDTVSPSAGLEGYLR